MSICRTRLQAVDGSSLLPDSDVHGVVIPIAIDELVIGINSGTRGRFLDDELKALTRASNPFLAHGERFFLVLLAAEDTYVDQIVERRRCFDAVAVGKDLPPLDGEYHFIRAIGHLLRGRFHSLVVIECDLLEAVIKEVLKIRGRLR